MRPEDPVQGGEQRPDPTAPSSDAPGCFGQSRSPRWWPEDEPWPPVGPPNREQWRGMRRKFFRRIGCLFFLLVILVVGFFSSLFWLLDSGSTLLPLPENVQAVLRVAMVIFLVFGFGGLIMLGRVIRRGAVPFGNLLDAAGRISDGDYDARVPERGPNEVRGLARAFNRMAENLQANDRQRRALLADVSHELRTPITILQGNLEGMVDGIYPADPDHLKSLLEETQVLSRIIDDLRVLSLAESGALKLQLETGNIASIVEETVSAFQPQAQLSSIILRTTIQSELPEFEIDPTRIREVLFNLLNNALRYTPAGGSVHVRAVLEGEHISVSVEDNGPGIAAADLPHVFDRFFKSADSRGSGLGLAIARSLVAAHGGEISAESKEGQGTTIRFSIPVKR